jgi:hypothetical protein
MIWDLDKMISYQFGKGEEGWSSRNIGNMNFVHGFSSSVAEPHHFYAALAPGKILMRLRLLPYWAKGKIIKMN